LGWGLLDPIGGMVLSTYIMIEWVKTLLQNFANRACRRQT
jgi:divalent metal cation (Fe/Co/Zn/Cd) transporter